MAKQIAERRVIKMPAALDAKLMKKLNSGKGQTKADFLTTAWDSHGKYLVNLLLAVGIEAGEEPIERFLLPMTDAVKDAVAKASEDTGVSQQTLLLAVIRLGLGVTKKKDKAKPVSGG